MSREGANEEVQRLVLGAIEAIDDGLAIIDGSHTVIWVNTWLERRYGSLGPLVGSKCFTFMASSNSPCEGCPLTFGEGDDARLVRQAPCPGSSEASLWIEVKGSALRDSEGRVTGAVAHFHDVTGRRSAEDALRAEVARRRALIEQSRDGIVVIDERGAVVEANLEFARMLGYTMEEVASLHVWDWDSHFSPEEILGQMAEDNSFGERFESVHHRKDGTAYEVEISQNRISEGDDAFNLCICRDVSEQRQLERERKAAQEALAEGASRRRLLVEQSRDGIVVLEENGRVWESNAAFAHMLGYSPEEMLSLHVWDWEYLYSHEQLLDMIAAVDDAGDHFVTKHRRKDGSTYEVEISTNGATYGGKKLIFCVCRDISEQRQAEREREALIAELKEALAELKTLRGIIPVCSFCKKVRDDRGYWEQVEVYIRKNSDADVSHGICPDCLKKHFPGMNTGPGQSSMGGSSSAK